mmetsp:Transcript_174963/g.425684  ORF Transcript_174963/g.425684 Transcript_174963/m.425684 type:complete len:256 (-) Transcript_174963:194-961(-)
MEHHVLELCEDPPEDYVDGEDLHPREFPNLQRGGPVQHLLAGGDPHARLECEVRGVSRFPHRGLRVEVRRLVAEIVLIEHHRQTQRRRIARVALSLTVLRKREDAVVVVVAGETGGDGVSLIEAEISVDVQPAARQRRRVRGVRHAVHHQVDAAAQRVVESHQSLDAVDVAHAPDDSLDVDQVHLAVGVDVLLGRGDIHGRELVTHQVVDAVEGAPHPLSAWPSARLKHEQHVVLEPDRGLGDVRVRLDPKTPGG